MRKQIILTGMLMLALLTPVSEARAQGWPNFDVSKLASLITNLIGRFQPVPQVLSRVNQVKSMISQVQAVGQAVLSGDLMAIGKAAAAGLKLDSFSAGNFKSPIESVAKGLNGSTDASKKIKDTLFSLKNSDKMSVDKVMEIEKSRAEYHQAVASEALSKAFYMVMNSQEQSDKRFEKADKAMKDAETIQDSVNANTMMIMAGNYERLNQISLELAKIKYAMVKRIEEMPVNGYSKPKLAKNLKMGHATFTEEEKDEIDVDFE